MQRLEPPHVIPLVGVAAVGLAAGLLVVLDPQAPGRIAADVANRVVVPPPAAAAVEPDKRDERDETPDCTCHHVAGLGVTPRELTALARACAEAAAADADDDDDHCSEPWSVFATLPDTVILQRSTGDCGGCGALTHATVFRGDSAIASGVLGRFGRFGSGAEAASWLDIGGTRALAIDSLESMGGFSDDTRSLFFIEGDKVTEGRCVTTSFSNSGAVEPDEQLQWTADIHVDRAGALDVRYRITHRGRHALKALPPRHLTPAEVRASVEECIGPDSAND